MIIRKADCRRDTFRSGGPGGQYQNKTETGVRYTHLETGISAESRSEASQHRNDRRAWANLIGKFQSLAEERARADRQARHDAKPPAAFGQHRRTYRLCGNPRVAVDHDTGVVETDVEAVLRGRIDRFLRANLEHAGCR